MTTTPVCSVCVHFTGARGCSAYAKIPDAVWLGSDNHLERRDDQVGKDTLTVRSAKAATYLHETGRVKSSDIVPIAS